MRSLKDSSLFYNEAINLIDLQDYDGAIKSIRKNIDTLMENEDIALAYLNCGFLNHELGDYLSAIDDFSKSICLESELEILSQRSKDISLNGRSNARYKCDDYKGAIDDKRKAKKIRLLEAIKYVEHKPKFLDYKIILLGCCDQIEMDSKYTLLIKISRIENSKYDLINDYKKFINEKKKQEVINSLEMKSDSRYKIGDYKGSIKAIRRSEKYYF